MSFKATAINSKLATLVTEVGQVGKNHDAVCKSVEAAVITRVCAELQVQCLFYRFLFD